MSKIKYMESFSTVDQCVNYLTSIGCKWDHNKEQELNKKSSFKFKDTIVFYDPYNLLT